MSDTMPVDSELNALKVIIEQNDVLIRYVADCRNILVALANKAGIKIEKVEQPVVASLTSVYKPMDELIA